MPVSTSRVSLPTLRRARPAPQGVRGRIARAVASRLRPRPVPAVRPSARVAWHVSGVLPLIGCLTSFPIGMAKASTVIPGVGYQGGFAAGWAHALNQPAYFTWLSNALVAGTSLTLATRRQTPTSDGFWAARTAGLGSVMVTGIVYNAVLRGHEQATVLYRVNDTLQHAVNPVLGPAVWALFDPRGQITPKRAALASAIPLAWAAVTMARGPRIDWYPYPFLDVPRHGPRTVGVVLAGILAGFTGLMGVLGGLDRRLGAGRRG